MKFAIIGGDMRIVRLAAMLEAEGHEICCYALDEAPADLIRSCALSVCAAQDADCVILPLPVLNMRGGLNAPLSAFTHDAEEILRKLPKNTVICGGMPGDKILKTAQELGLDFVDYFEREELVALNALATAEGTISVLLRNSPITIWDSRILIIGFGRIGKMLASRLRALGAHVSVSARKAGDMAYIRAMDCEALDTRKLGEELGRFDTIINTVPSRVLGYDQLKLLSKGALCIDLASRPGGFDFEAARELDINTIWALGLPAETAPVTAGKIIKETVLNIMREKRGEI
ncbi:MAG: dipicolinate synthase subunit DpsA [Clostridiales bacterium]|jgi:dipicolinate synthase subunit A|nr:dipicolinate synthase subunit DpsA [Clostridiales bacterium]